jgi:outer membrane protein assembly factor BamB
MSSICRNMIGVFLLIPLALVAFAGCSGGHGGVVLNPHTGVASFSGAAQESAVPLPRWVSCAKLKKPVAVPGAFPTTGQAPKKVKLYDNGSFDPDGQIVKWEWNFGDQDEGHGGWHDYTPTAGTAYHTYTRHGTYHAHLRVTDNDGNKDEDKIAITITRRGNANPIAQAHATPQFGTAPLEVSFNAAGSLDPDGVLVKWEWDLLGNGSFADYSLTEGVASYTYVAGSTYHPVLRVTDDNGAVAEASLTIYVNQVPNAVATATPEHGYPPMVVTFDGSGSSDPDGFIAKYEWDFGEGGGYEDFGNTSAASHTYLQAGNYTAMLRVTDNAGATATAAVSIDTTAEPPNQLPVAVGSVDPLSGTNPLSVQFNASSSYDPDGEIVSWEWDLGDGNGFQDYTGSQGALQFIYINSGNYSVTLRVTDDDAGSATASYTIHVNAHPSAVGHAIPDTGTAPLQSMFDANGSDDTDGSIVQWAWDFGEGAGFEDFTATHGEAAYIYNSQGNYTATLLVTDNEGGANSASIVITVTNPDLRGDWWMFSKGPDHSNRSSYVGPQTNTVAWRYYAGRDFCTNPVVASDGTLYVGDTDYPWSTSGIFYALNSDGTLKWSKELMGPCAAAALDKDGTVYTACGGWGGTEGTFYALNPDGSVKWLYTVGVNVDVGNCHGATIMPDGTVLFGGAADCKLYAFNPDGTVKWQYPTGGWIYASPALGADDTIYFGSRDSKVYALNPDGSTKWVYVAGGAFSSSASVASDGTIYLGCFDGKVYAINPDGSLKWSYQTGGEIRWNCPAIAADGTIYIGSNDRKLYALNPDGSRKWTFTTSGTVRCNPAIGADGVLYIGTEYGTDVYALNADGSLKWTYPVGLDLSSPAITADGMLIIGSRYGYIYAFKDP